MLVANLPYNVAVAGSAPEAERLLRAAGLDPGARGESLGVAEFVRLAAARAAARDFARRRRPGTQRRRALTNLRLGLVPPTDR